MSQEYAYIGIADGKVVAATVDNPKHGQDVAENLKEWVLAGYTVERVTVERARIAIGHPWKPGWGGTR